MRVPSAACRASGALLRVPAVGVALVPVSGALVLVLVRAEGGIEGIRGSAVGSGAGWVAAHASAGVFPPSAW
ncbi:MAG: hypothetical protein ACYC1E_17045 [Propionibacteriaceae bacterium]